MFDLKKVVRQSIQSLKPYSSARDEYTGKEGVFLDANENPFGQLNRYPDPYQQALKTELATFKGVTTEQIFIGNGSDEAIDLSFRIFCKPTVDKALTFSPTYGMYDVSAAINAIELIKIPLNDSFQIDYDSCQKYLSDDLVKLIFICSPNNPTGNIASIETIEKILTNFKGIVIIDEAYIDFSDSPSWTKMISKYPNLIVLQTFSKAWGLASARVGVAYSNKEVINYFNNVKPPYNVSKLNQEAALTALKNREAFDKNLAIIKNEKVRLKKELDLLSQVVKVYPSAANFLLVQMKNANGSYQYLIEKNIITRNRHSLIDNCLRISIGTPKENTQLLEALKRNEA